MIDFEFLILLGLSPILLCNGAVSPPVDAVDGNKFILLPGSTVSITWSFDDTITSISRRLWTYERLGVPFVALAKIDGNRDYDKLINNLFEFDIKKPATLVLKNVNQSYNGTYKFSLSPGVGRSASEVLVFIAVAPTVTLSCPNITTLNEGENFTCECRGEGGNPPAVVAWYKDGARISKTGKESQILSLFNVTAEDRGTYNCKAQSHVNASDEKSIEINVYFKPQNTAIRFSKNSVEIGGPVTITCTSDGFPEPRFTIFQNDTKIVCNDNTHTICKVNWGDAGTYKCFTSNTLGNDSAFAFLTVKELPKLIETTLSIKRPTTQKVSGAIANITTPTPKTTPNTSDKAASAECNSSTTEWHVIVISLVSGMIIGMLLTHLVSYSRRRWFRNRSPEPTEAQKTTADSTYQELDLKKMNKEDNYQSLQLRVNVERNDGANDDGSNYTELNKTRDDENNYQSLN